jgi:hypothetical protein
MGKIFVTPVTETAGSVMPNFEAVKGRRIGQRRLGMFFDVRAQLALKNRFEKSAHFFLFAARLELDPAVAQIPNRTGDLEALR